VVQFVSELFDGFHGCLHAPETTETQRGQALPARQLVLMRRGAGPPL
jgi:hypothetical protein